MYHLTVHKTMMLGKICRDYTRMKRISSYFSALFLHKVIKQLIKEMCLTNSNQQISLMRHYLLAENRNFRTRKRRASSLACNMLASFDWP